MGKAKKGRFFEIRFSLPSLVGLLFCWVGIAMIAFYLGFLMGRTEQMDRDIQRYPVSEREGEGEKSAQLFFPEVLTRPETELDTLFLSGQEGKKSGQESRKPVAAPVQAESPIPQPVLSSAESLSADPSHAQAKTKVLQVASFREKERAEVFVRQLKKKGYACFYSTSIHPESNKAYYRVFVGPVPNPKEAARMKADLEKKEGFRGILVRSATP